MVLDTEMLFTVATCVTGLLGVFLLVLWQQQRNVRALAWWGGVTPEMPNAFLFVACGMIWSGARLFC